MPLREARLRKQSLVPLSTAVRAAGATVAIAAAAVAIATAAVAISSAAISLATASLPLATASLPLATAVSLTATSIALAAATISFSAASRLRLGVERGDDVLLLAQQSGRRQPLLPVWPGRDAIYNQRESGRHRTDRPAALPLDLHVQ